MRTWIDASRTEHVGVQPQFVPIFTSQARGIAIDRKPKHDLSRSGRDQPGLCMMRSQALALEFAQNLADHLNRFLTREVFTLR
ncbi:hypothetical protein BSY18_4141 (plasmid) [Blastomonas sp. RAC04]|nr:hypothetical protein BSY18_4141 [Blastomonas sp. RAC04]